MASILERLPRSTFQLTITIPLSEVQVAKGEVLEEVLKNVEIKGFRKGKAPSKLAEKNVEKEKIYERAIQDLIPKFYLEALKEHNLHPLINPKIELISFPENKDWVFKATSCEKPEVKLGNYKVGVKELTAKSKIIVPAKEPQPPKLEEIFEVLLKSVNLEIPDILIESEVNRLLSKTLDDIKTLGLTVEQYLSSVGKTPETLREEYTQKARNDLILEFILEEIAEAEKITVSEEEINKVIATKENQKDKEKLLENRYLLASLLRRQKTFEFLKNL